MENVEEQESAIDGCAFSAPEKRERKLSNVSMSAEEKRSEAVFYVKTPSTERKARKNNSDETSSPVVVKKRESKSSDPKDKAEKKKKRSSIVSFAGQMMANHGFGKKNASTNKSCDKDEARTPSVGSPSSPSLMASSPVTHVRIKPPDEELASLAGDAAAAPEELGSAAQEAGLAAEDPAGTREPIYDSVPPLSPGAGKQEPIYGNVPLLSPVTEAPPEFPLRTETLPVVLSPVAETGPPLPETPDHTAVPPPTASELRDAALRTALGLPPLSAERLELARRAGVSWLAAGLTEEDTEEFWPRPEEEPWLDSAGARLREARLQHQVPPADLRRPGAEPALSDFAAARDSVALDEARVLRLEQAAACGGCGEAMSAGQLAVTAHLLPAAAWHPACFSCAPCGQRLADLLYCHHRGLPLCVRHFGDKLKQRCAACDELIFDGEFQRAGELAWHTAHLRCASCEEPLAGGQFGLHGRKPFCMACYDTASLGACEGCGLGLRPACRRLQYGSRQWHPACFVCGWCAASLEGRQFALPEGRAVCADCSSHPAPPPCPVCDVCGRPVAADSEIIEYKAGRCHDACFVCCMCAVPLGERTFMPKDQKLYCSRCYEETFATRCAKCSETITTLGLTFQGETWHRECFLCHLCKTSLAGRKFRTHEKKPYCKDCFRDTFGKRCSRCHGVLEGRYSAFQNRSWHNECFLCVDCDGSLVGTGFIDIDGDVLCQSCALQRQTAEPTHQERPPDDVLAE